jgi:hypothetical protein
MDRIEYNTVSARRFTKSITTSLYFLQRVSLTFSARVFKIKSVVFFASVSFL